MTVNECYQYVQQRLNKLASNSGDNLPKWTFVSTFNAQQLLWAGEKIKLGENNLTIIDEINVLLKSKSISPSPINDLYYEVDLPQDYLRYKNSTSLIPCRLRNVLVKEGNINTLLLDTNWKPSIEWGETLATIVGNKLRIYVDDFVINTVDITYYRKPLSINIATGHTDVNGDPTTNVNPEFADISVLKILDFVCEVLSSDIQDQWNLQTSNQRQQKRL